MEIYRFIFLNKGDVPEVSDDCIFKFNNTLYKGKERVEYGLMLHRDIFNIDIKATVQEFESSDGVICLEFHYDVVEENNDERFVHYYECISITVTKRNNVINYIEISPINNEYFQ